MRVFADLHHSDLFYSLQLLFEKRLGAELYRPIGKEWWEEGYWHIYHHPATIEQYLGLYQAIETSLDVFGNHLPERNMLNKNYRFEDGIYYVKDPTKDKVQRAVTLQKFKDMKFDIIISSIPAHIRPFNDLISRFQPQAKHIFQVGNAWGHQQGVKNVLASTAPFPVPLNVNICFYHQEFDLEIFHYEPPITSTQVNSYIHCMKGLDILSLYRVMLSDWQFKTYGAGMEDSIGFTADIAKAMLASGWTWHYKPEGDGYGFVLHNTYACGRPAIISEQHYSGKLGSRLLEDKITCIDISRRSHQEVAQVLQEYSSPEKHLSLCENAIRRFQEVINFDNEEQKIRSFLSRLS